MTDNSMIAAKAADGFKTESPIRAFTDFQVSGSYAIGKGFRPSLAHLSRYLDAMLVKEGWGLLQVILPRDSDGEPTILFERVPGRITLHTPSDCAGQVATDILKAGGSPKLLDSDPINPKHYDGRACADLGERLSANGYQMLKYCWRLGRKDDPCQEVGKALWYCDSEREFMRLEEGAGYTDIHHKPWVGDLEDPGTYLEDRIADQPTFTQNIARMLWSGYNLRKLQIIRETMDEHRFHLDCGRGLAI